MKTERFIMVHNEQLRMRLTHMASKALHEFISGPYLFGSLLLILGLFTIEPILAMSGSAILIGMVAISIKYEN